MEDAWGQVWGKAQISHVLSPNPMCSLTWKLSGPRPLSLYGSFTTQAELVNLTLFPAVV